jgi:hypothetical protein
MDHSHVPSFDGSSMDLALWLFKLEVIMEDRSDIEKIQLATKSLDGLALQWLYAVSQKEGNIKFENNWSKFKEAISARFQTPDMNQILRIRLDPLRQTGTLSKYIENFNSLVTQIRDLSEADKIFHFTKGLRPKIQPIFD